MGHTISGHPPTRAGRALIPSALSDAEFLTAFESCALAADSFHHYEHVRVAWIYLGAAPIEEATLRMAAGIRRFALHHSGSTAKYNEALTRAWVRLVAHARAMSEDAPSFAEFADSNPMLFDRKRAFDFYGMEAP